MLYYATGITPAMVAKMVGVGSQYAYAASAQIQAIIDAIEAKK